MTRAELPSAGRIKRAETTSAFGAGILGAGILGAGIALVLPGYLRSHALEILILGLVMHAWGMFDKHRLESRGGSPRVWWAELLYAVCWVALVALVVYLLLWRR